MISISFLVSILNSFELHNIPPFGQFNNIESSLSPWQLSTNLESSGSLKFLNTSIEIFPLTDTIWSNLIDVILSIFN